MWTWQNVKLRHLVVLCWLTLTVTCGSPSLGVHGYSEVTQYARGVGSTLNLTHSQNTPPLDLFLWSGSIYYYRDIDILPESALKLNGFLSSSCSISSGIVEIHSAYLTSAQQAAHVKRKISRSNYVWTAAWSFTGCVNTEPFCSPLDFTLDVQEQKSFQPHWGQL